MRGTVTKKKNRWYIVYYIGKDSNGKWKQKWEGSWDTKREAERVLRSRIEEVENTLTAKPINPPLRFSSDTGFQLTVFRSSLRIPSMAIV